MFSILIKNNDVVQADCASCLRGIVIKEAMPIFCPVCCAVFPDIESMATDKNDRLLYHMDEEVFE